MEEVLHKVKKKNHIDFIVEVVKMNSNLKDNETENQEGI